MSRSRWWGRPAPASEGVRGLVAFALSCFLLAVPATAAPPAIFETPLGPLEFLGEVRVPAGTRVDDTELGGLSALVYDRAAGVYHALSDDAAERGPARLYTLALDLSSGRLTPEGLSWKGVTRLLDTAGNPVLPKTVDPEGLALDPAGGFLVSSEGPVREGAAPFLRRYDRSGRMTGAIELPPELLPGTPGRGIRHNRGGEGLARTPDGRHLFLAIEGPLEQDGAEPTPTAGALARVYRFDLASGRLERAYLVPLESVHATARPAGELEVSGISGLLALDADTLVILERSFVRGVGNAARLARVDLREASDVSRTPSLAALDEAARAALRPAKREPILDLGALPGVAIDNIEGITLGPALPDGRRTLVLVSDDNFNPDEQVTQFLAFALGKTGLTVPAVQGAGHVSPEVGRFVAGLAGIVTAVDSGPRAPGFWLQSAPDGEAATSDALFVATVGPPAVAAGDEIKASGRIEERGPRGALSATVLGDLTVEVVGTGRPLPPAVPLAIPRGVMDDDGLTRFEPATDALDQLESLEGMRVEIADSVVIGPYDAGGIVVLADDGRGSTPRTARGGLRASERDPQPERVFLSDRLVPLPSTATVADRFPGTIRGVLDAIPAGYRLLPTEPPPTLVASGLAPEVTTIVPRPDRLTVASVNAENLDPSDPPEKFARLATTIVRSLAAPAVVALQEIQDDNGAASRDPDGVVTAGITLGRLIDAIVAAGGPRYTYRQIDPVDGAEGGEPGGNIRLAFLLDLKRVQPVDRGGGNPRDAVAVVAGPTLYPSPGRVTPADPAWKDSRVPLAIEVRFQGRPWFLVNNHWTSKGGDDRAFGTVQPPVPRSEPGRRAQARLVRAFVDELLRADPQARVIVLGDLNEHEGRSPLTELTAGGALVDLIERLPVEDRYTYLFEGRSQILDHILVSAALAEGAGIDVVHINAEFPEGERGSDHDPLVAGVKPNDTPGSDPGNVPPRSP